LLTTLNVQNLVVVREIEIEFQPGLTVLTGETGAGKSILIEALSLALGERSDSQLIRQGAERAVVTASFDVELQQPALEFLREHALDHGHDCILRRVLNKDGRSRAFCNASQVTVAMLRELAALLIDIHAQHAGQRLLQREYQRQLLDEYGELQEQRSVVAVAYAAWKQAQDELSALETMDMDRARVDLLRYQVDELVNANLDRDELGNIEDEFKKLANSSANLEQSAVIRQALSDDQGGVLNALDIAIAGARTLARNAPEGLNLIALLEQGGIVVSEALGELDSLESGLSADPERLAQLDRRLTELHNLASKHHVTLTDLGARTSDLEVELASYDQRHLKAAELREELSAARARYDDVATSLSIARTGTAKRMNEDISSRMRELGIPHATFAVGIEKTQPELPLSHGHDRVEFSVSTNPKQSPGALNKVASGGELSRITLAIHAATAQHSGVSVAVYDEVDTGIGGNTANIVGRSLRDVARHSQVICITHSPQVASAGEHHVLVDKQVVDGRSETTLRCLDPEARESEIARMLGAAEDTRSGIAHARDLLATARS
jgi:DNA repair protein RecN (Recombination protein N)